MTSKLWLLLALPVLLRLLRVKPKRSREAIIPPRDERVVLLGASSGIGRDLAHAYARRGARICIVARRADALASVKNECIELGLSEDKILLVQADMTSASDLVQLRTEISKAWGGLDTLHILAGVPSTTTLHDLSGVSLSNSASPASTKRIFSSSSFVPTPIDGLPSLDGLENVAKEARACAEINYVGTVLSLACFLPLLASSSISPALHHLSSVAADVPAPVRTIYSATKAAALMAVESCRVECEGCGVRFFSLLPGTIDNGFRLKTSTAQTGGRDELVLPIRHNWERLLLEPSTVIDSILYHLSLNPTPQPLIPIYPLSKITALSQPPKALVHLPWQYRMAFWMRDTPFGWGYLEKNARRKYGLPP
ncbi:hypothetical protein BCR39DRAFT_520919 [Naematelia encephala]|uniref:Short-chain dehydrogenase n=1 Tax=Naematelia encephala TaxID=71784 RepID=A0A1Y2BDY5_9TREE|nr:hypothetical protein BCR39DRAFT_520919 [Naematelia encephala]